MEGLLFTIFEDLDIPSLTGEECRDGLYYLEALLEREESPESFIKHHFIKMKLENRLNEVSQ